MSFVELAGWFFPTARQKQGLEDDTDLHKNEVTKLSLVTVYDSSPLLTDFPKGGFCAFPLLCSGALVIPLTSTPDQKTRLFLSPVDQVKQAPGVMGRSLASMSGYIHLLQQC